jgi:predicted CXXCH cytochrome family protein
MELVLFWLALSIGLVVLVHTGAGRVSRLWTGGTAVLIAGLGAVGQAAWSSRLQARVRADAALQARLPESSRPGGYLGSTYCRACHPSQYASWHRSYHRTMTQVATGESIQGRFDGVVLSGEGHDYRLRRREGEFWVDIDGAKSERIDLVTGSHHMQVYWTAGARGNEQTEFPFTYLLTDQRWVPRRDVFLIGPEFPKSISTWNRICIECHVTSGQPRLDPKSGAAQSRVAELGIACEACHGPGYDHVAANLSPLRRFTLHAGREHDNTITNPARLRAEAATQVCGQCHGIGCNLAGWTWAGLRWQPGQNLEEAKPLVRVGATDGSPCRTQIEADPSFQDSRFWSDGMVRVSGREYNALHESPCYRGGQLSCLSCHSMHSGAPDDQLTRAENGDEDCLACHGEYRSRLAAHTHHSAGSSGSRCQNCHMPYTTFGLLKAIRSHQVDSPRVATTLATGRPNACNLCHLEKPLAWTADRLSAWYGHKAPPLDSSDQRVAASILGILRGDAGQRALWAYSMGWETARAASQDYWMAPWLIHLLDDPYAAVRYVASRSLRTLPGFADLAYDYVAAPSARKSAQACAQARWQAILTARVGDRREIHGPNDALSQAAIDRLAAQRNDRNMFLAE